MIDITDRITIRLYFPTTPSLFELIINGSEVVIEWVEDTEASTFDDVRFAGEDVRFRLQLRLRFTGPLCGWRYVTGVSSKLKKENLSSLKIFNIKRTKQWNRRVF